MSSKIQKSCADAVREYESRSDAQQAPLTTNYCSAQDLDNLGFKPTMTEAWVQLTCNNVLLTVVPSKLFSGGVAEAPVFKSKRISVEDLAEEIKAEIQDLLTSQNLFSGNLEDVLSLNLNDARVKAALQAINKKLKDNRLQRNYAYTDKMTRAEFYAIDFLLKAEDFVRYTMNGDDLNDALSEDYRAMLNPPGIDRRDQIKAKLDNNNK